MTNRMADGIMEGSMEGCDVAYAAAADTMV